MKKGDRVEFTTREGTLVTGYIKSVSKTGTVKMVEEGGDTEWKVGVRLLRPATKLIETDEPSVMDKWGIKGFKEVHGHDDSLPFEARITLNGKVVGEASNDGWGGSNMYHFTDHATRERFTADAKAWFAQLGGTDTFEVEGLWVEWATIKKPYGVTAKAYIADFNTVMES